MRGSQFVSVLVLEDEFAQTNITTEVVVAVVLNEVNNILNRDESVGGEVASPVAVVDDSACSVVLDSLYIVGDILSHDSHDIDSFGQVAHRLLLLHSQ
jgi:hypothetical protein